MAAWAVVETAEDGVEGEGAKGREETQTHTTHLVLAWEGIGSGGRRRGVWHGGREKQVSLFYLVTCPIYAGQEREGSGGKEGVEEGSEGG